jgi:hypothetical protein
VLLLDIVLIFIVDVDVGTFNISQTWKQLARQNNRTWRDEYTFELSLQCLTDVVSDLEWKVLVHDNVNLYIVVLPSMVGSALCHVSSLPSPLALGLRHVPYPLW